VTREANEAPRREQNNKKKTRNSKKSQQTAAKKQRKGQGREEGKQQSPEYSPYTTDNQESVKLYTAVIPAIRLHSLDAPYCLS